LAGVHLINNAQQDGNKCLATNFWKGAYNNNHSYKHRQNTHSHTRSRK